MPAGKFDEILQYQGRSALRSDSRIRRKAILEAALRVIERDGVRGVKHRAVAIEADVPLAATTYYFDDIQALLHDAFVHYVETRLSNTSARLQEQGLALLQQYSLLKKQSAAAQQMADQLRELSGDIALVLLAHVRSQVERQAERRVEVAFRQEALLNPGLARLVSIPHQVQLEAIQEFFQALGSKDCPADAQVTMGVLLYLEYILTLSGTDAEWELAKNTLQRMVEGLLRLPDA